MISRCGALCGVFSTPKFKLIQLCDFGLARSARPPPDVDDSTTFMTEYVATRYGFIRKLCLLELTGLGGTVHLK